MRCRCIAYAVYAAGDEKPLRCRNKTRRPTGICKSCRPFGKHDPSWCGPLRRLAPLQKAYSDDR